MIVRHEHSRSRPGPDRPPQFDCGHVHIGLTLSDREWSCVECGVIHDRDRNAAINLMNFAASSAVTACREEAADVSPRTAVKPASVKQEPEREAFAYV